MTGYYGDLGSSSSEEADIALEESQRDQRTVWRPGSTVNVVLGDTFEGRVVKVALLECYVDILKIGDGRNLRPSQRPAALLRRRDVRSFQQDKVVMGRSYHLGDIIKGTVTGVEVGGWRKMHRISTAQPDEGVIKATSSAGGDLQPLSWCLMKCAATGQLEHRKVAKRLY